ncbi:hypothetical protein TrCOL_g11579 [Triparma columacea]|uniref:Uncharacterized protein n=1 Tax=Triparma columacea TaxID=722753 RepID=A0A9W7G2T5_9STRA|nr:hypothetical protein TrCOL_g11579 [Triparma columacea]
MVQMMKLLAQTGFLAGVLPYIELYILPKDPTFSFLTSPSPLGLQRGASIGLTIHVVAGFWITLWGLMVGSKRSVYREKARKDGEKDVDQRYGLPNLYVEGCTKHSKAFNCVQRSHQQIFETLAQFITANLIATIYFPISASVSVLVWFVGRVTWAKGYAASEGDPSKRYDSPFAYGIWTGYLSSMLLAVATCVRVIMGW